VDIELLYFDGCPNWRRARRNVVEALAQIGRPDVAVTPRVIESDEHAYSERFIGSPTIRIDGVDPFDAEDAVEFGLACRVYSTPRGAAGVPTVEQLVAVLTTESARTSSSA
jgi:hypothetical protein